MCPALLRGVAGRNGGYLLNEFSIAVLSDKSRLQDVRQSLLESGDGLSSVGGKRQSEAATPELKAASST